MKKGRAGALPFTTPYFFGELLVHPQKHESATLQLHIIFFRTDYRALGRSSCGGRQLQIPKSNHSLCFPGDGFVRIRCG